MAFDRLAWIFSLALITSVVQEVTAKEVTCANGPFGSGDITTVDGVTIRGSEQSFIKLTIEPNSMDALVNLTITDDIGKVVLVEFIDANVTEAFDLGSNGHIVTIEGSGTWDLSISCTEMNVTLESNTFTDINGSVVITDVESNSRIRNEFEGILQSLQLYDVNWNIGGPSNGFVAVLSPNGRIGIVTAMPYGSNQPSQIAIMPSAQHKNGSTYMDLIIQNTLQDLGRARVDITYSLGEEIISTTTTTTTTDTPDPTLNNVVIFVIGVNEQDFYVNKLDTLKNLTEELADPYLTADSKCDFDYSPLISCRKRCHMTNDPDRGCVMLTVSVETNIFCSFSNDLLREEMTSSVLKSWSKELGARRVSIDDCMADEDGWIIMAIVVPAVVVALLVGAAAFVHFYLKPKRREEKIRKASARQESWRDETRTGSHGGRSKRHIAYSNHLDIIED